MAAALADGKGEGQIEMKAALLLCCFPGLMHQGVISQTKAVSVGMSAKKAIFSSL